MREGVEEKGGKQRECFHFQYFIPIFLEFDTTVAMTFLFILSTSRLLFHSTWLGIF